MERKTKFLCVLLLMAVTTALNAAPPQDGQGAAAIQSWWNGVVEQVGAVFSFFTSCTGPDCPAGGGQSGPEPGTEPSGGQSGPEPGTEPDGGDGQHEAIEREEAEAAQHG